MIAARARNGVIGHNGGLIWHIPSDLKYFKSVTTGKPVIMGRKTWEGLALRPLPGRHNIVVTGNRKYTAPGACLAHSLEDAAANAIAYAGSAGLDEIFIIGGAQIYRAALAMTERIYLSEIALDAPGDATFPALDPAGWREVSRTGHARGPTDEAAFETVVLERL